MIIINLLIYNIMENYLVINSKYRNLNDTSTNFKIKLSKNILIKKYIKLIYCAIPESSYLINENNFIFEIVFTDLVKKTINIPYGNYNPSSLALQITNLVNYDSFICNFDNSINKFILSSSTKDFTINYVNNSINYILGFNNQNYASSGLILYSQNIINFIQPNILYICIKNLNNNRLITNINYNVSYFVPVTALKNNVSYYFNSDYLNVIYVNDVKLNEIELEVITDDGNTYNNNNLDCQFAFIFE